MPWKGKKDVERHNKRCAQYTACVKLWLKVANKHYKKTRDDGQAVIRANIAAKKWMQTHGKIRRRKLKRKNPCPSRPLSVREAKKIVLSHIRKKRKR